jgi:hypothetical protein
MFADELESGGWSNLGNWIEIVAPQEDTEIDELIRKCQ